ncbi:uncharacterized protein LOC116440563 isoform X1 [Corvus moneduloides]|uniref:uncharacterized protein LOC116440563 isoform X1 n=2 Tax=Corvus moneduloides TaxID=1196302 RepID=UPI00136221EE|nr:uncharacterized protein LOC116440563 isoform X1 [Corvus moneduloides]
MEGTGPGWLVPSSHRDHQMLLALTSDASKEFCNNRRGNKASQSSSFTERNNSTSNTVAFTYSLAPWLPRNLSGRPAGTARVHRSDAEEESPGPSLGEGRAAGRLRAGSSPSSAAAAGMLRSAASGGQRPLQLGGSASGVQGLRQPAGAPGPRSLKHRRPGAFISHPVLFPQVHHLRPPSPSSSPASPRVTTDRSPLSLSLSFQALPEEETARRGCSSCISPPGKRCRRSA